LPPGEIATPVPRGSESSEMPVKQGFSAVMRV
jgi:hypothetical protein